METAFFGKTTPTEILDMLVDETAGSLSLLSDFSVLGMTQDDEIVQDRPGEDESVRIAIRFGFKTPRGARVGFMQFPLADALVLGGELLMMPHDMIRDAMESDAPDEGQKEAIMEVGNLLGGAFDSLLAKRLSDQTLVRFLGCQGVPAGRAPWVPGYTGENIAVRRHSVSFGDFTPFDLLIAIPA